MSSFTLSLKLFQTFMIFYFRWPLTQKKIFWRTWVSNYNYNYPFQSEFIVVSNTSSPFSRFKFSNIFSQEARLWCNVRNVTLMRKLIKVYWVGAMSVVPQGYRQCKQPQGPQLCRYIHNISPAEAGVEFHWLTFTFQKLQHCLNYTWQQSSANGI